MYGHMNKELRLVSDAPGMNQVVAGDVIEIAYNLYTMYATLNIDVALLLNVDPSVLQGWWAQVNLIQRDAYIETAAMLAGKGTIRFSFRTGMYLCFELDSASGNGSYIRCERSRITCSHLSGFHGVEYVGREWGSYGRPPL